MKVISLLLVASLISTPLLAQDTVTLAVDDWKPYMGAGLPDGGPITQIVKESFKAAGVKVDITQTNWARAEKMVSKGQVIASYPWAKSEKRLKKFKYGEKILTTKNVFFHRKDVNFSWNSIEDLKKYKITITRSYAYSDELTKAFSDKVLTPKIGQSDKANIEMLKNGQADIFPCSIDVCKQLVKELGASNITFSEVKPVSTADYYFIVSKKRPEADKILKSFSEGFNKVKASGKFSEYLK